MLFAVKSESIEMVNENVECMEGLRNGMKRNRSYSFIRCIWFVVPIISFGILNNYPLIIIGNGYMLRPVSKQYTGLQILFTGAFLDYYKNTAIAMNLELVALKIMIAIQLLSNVILIFLPFWEYKRQKKFYLWIRGIISAGYVGTSVAIYCLVRLCVIHHKAADSLFVQYYQNYLESYILFSISIMVLYIITLFIVKKKRIC